MDWQEATHRFITYCENKGLSQHTVRAYRQDLAAFVLWIATRDPKAPFNRQFISDWLSFLREKDLAPSSIKRKTASVKVLFRWLTEEEKISDNPFLKFPVRIRLPRILPRDLKANELKKTSRFRPDLNKNNSHMWFQDLAIRVAIELMFTTGVRVGEVCSLCLADIDLETDSITILGKGNRERTVFIVDNSSRLILNHYINNRIKYAKNNQRLLISTKGNGMKADAIRHNLNRLCKRLGIERHITPHMLRHSAATHPMASKNISTP